MTPHITVYALARRALHDTQLLDHDDRSSFLDGFFCGYRDAEQNLPTLSPSDPYSPAFRKGYESGSKEKS